MLEISGNYWEICYEKISKKSFNKIKKALENLEDDDNCFYLEKEFYRVLLDDCYRLFEKNRLKYEGTELPFDKPIIQTYQHFNPFEPDSYYIVSVAYFKNGFAEIEEDCIVKEFTFNYDVNDFNILFFYNNNEEENLPDIEYGRSSSTSYFLCKTTKENILKVIIDGDLE